METVTRARVMKRAFILLIVGVLISQFHLIDSKDEVRDTPRLWCGAGPPYTGTLFHTKMYGFPFPAFEVVSHESCTTIHNERIQIIPEGAVFNVIIFFSLGILFKFIVRAQSYEGVKK